MASIYDHGISVKEESTKMTAPTVSTAGLQVVVGTAPVHMLKNPASAVNKPILVSSKKEAAAAFGFSTDFAKYTLCESVSINSDVVNVAPLVMINVLDPEKHSAALEETTLAVNMGTAELAQEGILPGTLTVKSGETVLAAGTDYTTAFSDDGTLRIVLIADSAGAGATTLMVTGKRLDAELVTNADIIGGVDAQTGAETGLEVIRQVYPKLGMVPGILLAPRYSADAAVAAALQAKTYEVSGVFRCVCIADVDSRSAGARKYTDVKEQKEKQALSDANAYAVWPFVKVGETIYSGSSAAGALTVYTDARNGDVPNVSPSNKKLPVTAACLADGTEVVLDADAANTLNGWGVATFLNMSGFRLHGNNTAAYPGTKDPKDRWFSTRRFMSWAANTFILSYYDKVDSPLNKALIDAIVDSENIRGNGFVAQGRCARYEMVYNEEDNPKERLLDGKIVFRQYITLYGPAEYIENILEFDPDALESALA